LAAWAWAEKNGQDPQAFVKALFEHVPVLDKGARDSTTTFAQRGIGDVLLAWENEAYLALAELGEDQFNIVVPSVSVLAEPPVALVEANIKTEDQRKLAEAYLNFLYTPEAQAFIFGLLSRLIVEAAPEDAFASRTGLCAITPEAGLAGGGLNLSVTASIFDQTVGQ
jgi:sulfate transport system substrate-binding protein